MASSNFIRLLDAVACPMGTGNWTYGSGTNAESYQTEVSSMYP